MRDPRHRRRHTQQHAGRQGIGGLRGARRQRVDAQNAAKVEHGASLA
jgi:hypothetical protein